MTGRPGRLAWAVAIAIAVIGSLALPAPAVAADPSVTVDRTTATLGNTVNVALFRWPAGVVTVALCGNDAREGSADCAVPSASSVSVPAGGSATLRLRLVAPPVGCPCVIRAATVTGDRIAATAIDVTDVPDAAVVTTAGAGAGATGARLTVTGTVIEHRWSIGALFGGPAHRTLRIAVRNDGTSAASGAEITLDLGRAAGSRAPAAVPLGVLEAGGERRVAVPFTVAAPAAGRYPISGRIDGAAGTEATFTARTDAWPWLLPLTPGVLITGFFLIRRVRRARPSPLQAGGIALIGAGAVCAVVLAAQTLLPGPETAEAQQALDDRLAAAWTATPPAGAPSAGSPSAGGPSAGTVTGLDAPAAVPPAGEPFAVLHVPRWTAKYTVVEGVRTADLRKGPGHYPGTALPGQIGNMAVAGHRGPAGLPFNDIDRLRAGDPIVVETASAWYVYRTQRHLIVPPTRVDVVAPTPERPGVAPAKAMLTLTACHPRFSSRQRYVLFAELAEVTSKATGQRPAALG